MHEPKLNYLFQAYFSGTATPAEQDELMELLAQAEYDDQLKSLLAAAWERFHVQERPFSTGQGEQMLAHIFEQGTAEPTPVLKSRKQRPVRLLVAALLSIFAVGGSYFLLPHRQPSRQPVTVAQMPAADSIVPGGNKAILTTSTGARIVLDSTSLGTLTTQGNASVVNLQSATLAYHAGNGREAAPVFNTLSTPNGAQYQLLLSDGTRVWLNASSSLHFPATFQGKERAVALTGEAYFEVAKRSDMPFTVSVNGMKVKVLGTHFNVMAYGDEQSVNTTLLEGSVRVQNGPLQKELVPGQESRLQQGGQLDIVEADLEEVMAWKNGWFQFNACDIQKVMRQIARWYNVDVVYEGRIPAGHFSGLVSRENSIAQVLRIMQAGGVQFTIEGRKVLVSRVHAD